MSGAFLYLTTIFFSLKVNLRFNIDNNGPAGNNGPAVGRNGRRQFNSEELNVDGLRIRNVDPLAKGALRIRGGNSTDTLNYPYMAAIIINGRLWCAGAIVDSNWIITAAHCLN